MAGSMHNYVHIAIGRNWSIQITSLRSWPFTISLHIIRERRTWLTINVCNISGIRHNETCWNLNMWSVMFMCDLWCECVIWTWGICKNNIWSERKLNHKLPERKLIKSKYSASLVLNNKVSKKSLNKKKREPSIELTETVKLLVDLQISAKNPVNNWRKYQLHLTSAKRTSRRTSCRVSGETLSMMMKSASCIGIVKSRSFTASSGIRS